MDLITMTTKIHPTIWGVLIGSTLTLLGTFLQGKSALKLLLRQKALENASKKEYRDFELKKDNYLHAVKCISQLMNVFIDFAKPGISFDNVSKKVQELFNELVAIDLVANKETVDPIHKFQKYYFQTFMELMNEKIPHEAIVIEKNNIQNTYDLYSEKIEENKALLKNNSNNLSSIEEGVQKTLNEYYTEKNKCLNILNELSEKLFKAELDFKRKAIDKLFYMNQFLSEFIRSARCDLGIDDIPIDYSELNAFHQHARDMAEKTFLKVEELTSKDYNWEIKNDHANFY